MSSKNVEIDVYLGKSFSMSDMEQVVGEVFPGEKTIIQEIELFGDMAAITIPDTRSDEELNSKVEELNTKINEKFEAVSWNLFENQINGGLKETCECTVNGVPYSSLNDGHKIIAGLDIIKSMSRLHNVSAPIFIDNAESINEYNIPDTGAQMIFLRVTDDKSLVIEGVNV